MLATIATGPLVKHCAFGLLEAEPIKNLGEYEVAIRLSADVTVPLKLSVVAEDGDNAAS